MFNKLKGYAMGTGANPMYQNIADYGAAALLGVGGQQAINALTPGSDPNPFLSGAIAAPALTALGRGGRRMYHRNEAGQEVGLGELFNRSPINPYERAAMNASAAGVLSGVATSGYNTIAGGADIDNNMVAIPAALLAGAFPMASMLMRNKGAVPVREQAVYPVNPAYPRQPPYQGDGSF